MSKEEKSKDDDEHDNIAVGMALPAKKSKTTRHIVSRKPRKVVESDDNFDAFPPRRRVSLATVARTFWPSEGPHQQKRSLVKN
jgi:hypothetical protein